MVMISCSQIAASDYAEIKLLFGQFRLSNGGIRYAGGAGGTALVGRWANTAARWVSDSDQGERGPWFPISGQN